jgi:hypothetical protein
MDRLVDQADEPGVMGEATTTDDVAVTDEDDAEDIESELYSSTREAGIAPVGFTPVDDT